MVVRRHYNDQEKKAFIKEIIEKGYSFSIASKKFKISEVSLRRWFKEFEKRVKNELKREAAEKAYLEEKRKNDDPLLLKNKPLEQAPKQPVRIPVPNERERLKIENKDLKNENKALCLMLVQDQHEKKILRDQNTLFRKMINVDINEHA